MLILLLLLLAFGATAPLPVRAAVAPENGRSLIAELGCANCHTGINAEGNLRQRTPDLSSAGLRYNPAYIFDYLRNPQKVRRHLGRARMPGFHLADEEALALTLFLETQRTPSTNAPPWPADIARQLNATPAPVSRQQFQNELARGLICLTCHTIEGKGGSIGPELTSISYRLQPAWAKTYLVAPWAFGVPPATMPMQFFQPGPDGQNFHELVPGAADRIRILTDYLFSLNAEQRRELEGRYVAAKAALPKVTPAMGNELFVAFNCAACHRSRTDPPRTTNAAPDLAAEGLRVNESWLQPFLKKPHAVRPFGYEPGDGSRMPDFRLSDQEAADISSFLSLQKEGSPGTTNFHPRPLSAFSARKARLLLADKLACLGCHRLGSVGGMIGPDLTNVRSRLRPDFIYSIITEPRKVAPHSIMPRIPLTTETATLIANYLLQQPEAPVAPNYLSPLRHPLIPHSPEASNRAVYLRNCAACHGAEGHGDGFNAAFLPVKPTAHADAAYLSTRPDDTLYDGVFSGGYILNKSHLMPPWGDTLSSSEIKGLVGFMRTVCKCQAPAWSRDNLASPEPK